MDFRRQRETSDALFELLAPINPDRGHWTCVGTAPSKGRRCQNPVNAGNRGNFKDAVYDLAGSDLTNRRRRLALLEEIAGYGLCVRYHQGQYKTKAGQWSCLIDTWLSEQLPSREPARSTTALPSSPNRSATQTVHTSSSTARTIARAPTAPRDARGAVDEGELVETVSRSSRIESSNNATPRPIFAGVESEQPRASRAAPFSAFGSTQAVSSSPFGSTRAVPSSVFGSTRAQSPFQFGYTANTFGASNRLPAAPTHEPRQDAAQGARPQAIAVSTESSGSASPPEVTSSASVVPNLTDAGSGEAPEPVTPLLPARCNQQHATRRGTDEECPVCQSTMASATLEELVWCKGQCGINLHRGCWDEWARTPRSREANCVYCRGRWLAPCCHDTETKPPYSFWAMSSDSGPEFASFFNVRAHAWSPWMAGEEDVGMVSLFDPVRHQRPLRSERRGNLLDAPTDSATSQSDAGLETLFDIKTHAVFDPWASWEQDEHYLGFHVLFDSRRHCRPLLSQRRGGSDILASLDDGTDLQSLFYEPEPVLPVDEESLTEEQPLASPVARLYHLPELNFSQSSSLRVSVLRASVLRASRPPVSGRPASGPRGSERRTFDRIPTYQAMVKQPHSMVYTEDPRLQHELQDPEPVWKSKWSLVRQCFLGCF